ncbi:hypothetical protein [Cupriavidus sp. EM10]|uniref:hypothetical protein n=1 Tax=Cupriavidus sp. EM10 TaxID=2839983 RepID=UPI001CECE215|nr:hypothetical protein [Cupriavidus sp. EM10]
MIKFRLDVFSYLLVAIVGGCLVWFKGDLFWLDSDTRRTAAIVALCCLLVVIALYFGFETRRDEAHAVQRLAKLLQWNPSQLSGTTQALLARRMPGLGNQKLRQRWKTCAIDFGSNMVLAGDIGGHGCCLPGTMRQSAGCSRSLKARAGY